MYLTRILLTTDFLSLNILFHAQEVLCLCAVICAVWFTFFLQLQLQLHFLSFIYIYILIDCYQTIALRINKYSDSDSEFDFNLAE